MTVVVCENRDHGFESPDLIEGLPPQPRAYIDSFGALSILSHRRTSLLALVSMCTVTLFLASLTKTRYIQQTQPNVGPVWSQDENGNAVRVYPLFNFPASAYRGIWTCGWPFALFTLEAGQLANNDGPFFPFHDLTVLEFEWYGWFATIAIIIPISFVAAIGIHSVITLLSLRLTIRVLMIAIALFSWHFHNTLEWIEDEELLIGTPQMYAAELIASNLVVLIAHVIIWVAIALACHPTYLRHWWRYFFGTTEDMASEPID